jgi:hypothetical protein
MLDLGTVKKFLSCDADAGILRWKVAPCNRVQVGDSAGCLAANGYVLIRLKNKLLKAHRVVWALHFGKWPKEDIDHINGNKSDNRLANLREVDRSTNNENQRGPGNANKTGFLGVYFNNQKQKYQAAIYVKGVKKHLGFFDAPEEGHQAYLKAKRVLHAGNTL